MLNDENLKKKDLIQKEMSHGTQFFQFVVQQDNNKYVS